MPNIAFLSTAHTHTKGFLKAVSERDGSDIVAIWDDMENRGQNFANEYGAEFSADLDAVVGRDDVDGFIVCVENTKHLPLLEAAIPTKKPIFCEKPFMTTVEDALKAVSLIREHGTIVHMGYFQPFSAEMQGVIAHVDSGALGNLTHARYRNAHHAAYGRWFDSDELAWFHNPALAGGGAFMDMGTHAVHLMRTILGPVKEVLATISNVSGIYNDVDDNGVAMFRFENGVVATVEGSWIQTGGPRSLEVIGSDATLFEKSGRGFVTQKPREEPEDIATGTERPTRVDRLVAAINGELTAEELDADLACAVDAVAIMEACYKSNESKQWELVTKV
ncbi:Gfo/Idh/MocA family oxidoreductase [bacterium]|nr:Gfo/Idh/MocA family oxidoreductase [bacterium]